MIKCSLIRDLHGIYYLLMSLIESSGKFVLDVLEMLLFICMRVEEDEFQFCGHGFDSLGNRKALLKVFDRARV